MPYAQAKRLQALTEYLEAIGASDIKDLPYGAGRPPPDGEEVFAGSAMSHFWAYKAGERIGEFSDPIISSSNMSAPAVPTTDIFSSLFGYPTTPSLSLDTLAFNNEHAIIQRVHPRYFRVTVPFDDKNEIFVIDALTVRHWIEYSTALVSGNDVPEHMPMFYNAWAQLANEHDHSNYFWPYFLNGEIAWKDNGIPPTVQAFCLTDGEVFERPMLRMGEVAVTSEFYENAQRLADLERRRELKYYKLRNDKKSKGSGSLADVTSKSAMDNFAKKREALAAKLRANTAGNAAGAGAGSSGAAGDGDLNMA
ncbi:hypothetical protein DFH08DRAFT_416931 [Mycena albidolilacea]|uniref:Uncharacterized protein n=1 Tax=Mycena albidolilacea TaxID=1033008 RepID=A0AAD7AIN8_9AGAR|nr:hypothetical protein DFH08DRAFT_416931 [Mycena albidolilacea]